MIELLIIAILIDVIFGEPPLFMHPVVWMGKLINLLVRREAKHLKLYGLVVAMLCIAISIITGVIISLGKGFFIIISAYFLKSSFSIRMFLLSAIGIKRELELGNIDKVRENLKTFVGRDTSQLDEHHAASAVIESLSENFVDGILSPLFYFLIFGLPGALAYRTINTLDSMIGYKNESFGEIGYVSAKIDDIANFLPSRLSVIFIFIASLLFGNAFNALKTCISEHNKTPSPNSGLSMSMISGALKIRLEKMGCYVIGEEYELPEPYHIQKAVNIIGFSSLIVIVVILLILLAKES